MKKKKPHQLIQIDPKRVPLFDALAAMTDEAFSHFVVWAQHGFPDGIGGFNEADELAIARLRQAAANFIAN